MSLDLTSLSKKVNMIVNDPGFTSDMVTDYLNEGMRSISGGIQRPDSSVLTSPLPMLFSIDTVTTSTTDTKISLPDDYQRDVVFVADSYGRELEIYDNFMDFSRSYPLMNQTGDVNAIAIKGNYLYYQPIPTSAATLTVHYYRQPTDMAIGTDEPDGLPEQYRNLLVYYAAKEFFALIEDGLDGGMPNYQKWEAKFQQLLMRFEASIPNDAGLTYL